jgi:hypothetical protein
VAAPARSKVAISLNLLEFLARVSSVGHVLERGVGAAEGANEGAAEGVGKGDGRRATRVVAILLM